MILTIGLTQFVFVSLGILTLNVLLKAGGYAPNVASSFPPFPVWLALNSLWVFILPMAWIIFAGLCGYFRRGPLSESVARVSGVGIMVGIFLAYFYACAQLI
jgi:hypothetical protein